MSIFTSIPEGYWQPSRFAEQEEAVSRPTQWTLRTMLIVMTVCAATCGTANAVKNLLGKEVTKTASTVTIKTANPQP